MKKHLIAGLVGLGVGSLVVMLWHAASSRPVPSGVISTEIPPGVVEVVMNDSGYSPMELVLAPGSTVAFINAGDGDRWPASNIHPTHGLYPEFDPGQSIRPGQVWIFTFKKAGHWPMHDHIDPDIIGAITVE